MTDTNTTADPDAGTEAQVVEVNEPMTVEEAAKQVAARKATNRGEAPKPEETETKPEGEVEGTEVEDEAKDETSDSDKGVLSKFDIESLDDDERADLAIELGSGAGKAIGKQRKEIRELKGKLESANKAKEAAIKLAPSADVPFPELRTVEAVDAKIEEIDEALSEWTDRMTFEQVEEVDDAGNDVKGVKKDGKFYSLQALKQWRDGERKALKGLRAQKSSVRKLEKLFEDEDVRIETNKVDLGIEEGSKSSDLYEAYLEDPQFQVLKVQMPELASKLLDVFAYAAASQGGTVEKKKPAKRAAPKATSNNSIPRGGAGTPSSQAQLSVLEQTIRDGNKPMAVRKQAAVDLRQFKSQLRQ